MPSMRLANVHFDDYKSSKNLPWFNTSYISPNALVLVKQASQWLAERVHVTSYMAPSAEYPSEEQERHMTPASARSGQACICPATLSARPIHEEPIFIMVVQMIENMWENK
eukprot:scaffold271521_cov33-Prasinocladus_malaysianus.AAC.1